MKNFWSVLFVLSVVVVVVSVTLLLNFTAPNPTGRRYSSESPTTTGQGTTEEIGLSGERILSRDLGLPRNDSPDFRQCICSQLPPHYGSPPLSECRVCIAQVQLTASFRRPDFIGFDYIAESKNSNNLLYTGREVDQIGDYALAARAMNKPLWIFIRVNTNIDTEFIRLAESTGGGVVPYFTVPGYVDPIDQAATAGLFVGSAGAGLSLIGLTRPWRRFMRRKPTPKWKPKDYPEIIEDAKRKAQETIDKEDSRHDI